MRTRESPAAYVLERGEIESIVELKSQAEVIRVLTIQKNLGKDAELAAAEIVRRATAVIASAVRRGQDEGRIAARGDIGESKQGDAPRGEHLLRPGDYFDGEKEKHDAYAMVDGVTPEQFDAAIEEAKVEGNLSPLRS